MSLVKWYVDHGIPKPLAIKYWLENTQVCFSLSWRGLSVQLLLPFVNGQFICREPKRLISIQFTRHKPHVENPAR